MKAATIIGVILLVAGVIGFVAGGISYTTSEQVVDMGPIEVEAEETKSFPSTPLASGIALLSGAALVYVGQKKS
ncbi:MAG: DUF3185 domain-containing protein [Rhodothermia bacterium]|nr:DUF3185 domain-containing protein [Rhodothermia bacterium]